MILRFAYLNLKYLFTRDCRHACGTTEPFGFVPECGCPIHDRGEWLDFGWLFRVAGPVVRFFKRHEGAAGNYACPWCGYDKFTPLERPWYVALDGGKSYVLGEPDEYWTKGWQVCPRCNFAYEVDG